MEKVQYKKNEFESGKDYSVIVTMVGQNNASAVSGLASGELLNELEDVLARITAYNQERNSDTCDEMANKSQNQSAKRPERPWKIWWVLYNTDGKAIDHGVYPKEYKRRGNAELTAREKYNDNGYVYKVSQSVPWPEMGYFRKKA